MPPNTVLLEPMFSETSLNLATLATGRAGSGAVNPPLVTAETEGCLGSLAAGGAGPHAVIRLVSAETEGCLAGFATQRAGSLVGEDPSTTRWARPLLAPGPDGDLGLLEEETSSRLELKVLGGEDPRPCLTSVIGRELVYSR